jgi:hypothetical protein
VRRDAARQEWKKVWAKEATDSLGSVGSRIAQLKPELLLSAPPFRVTTAGIRLLSPTGAVLERPTV